MGRKSLQNARPSWEGFLTAVGFFAVLQARVTPSIPQTRLDSFFKPTAPKVADAKEEKEEGTEGEEKEDGKKEEKGEEKEEEKEEKEEEEEGKQNKEEGEEEASEKSSARKFGGKKRGREE